MKILIVGFTKIKYMPYAKFYLDEVCYEKNEVHLITWNRDCAEDIKLSYNVNIHQFNRFQQDEVKKIKKIMNFIRFRNYAKRIIKNEKFDLLIILHTIPGVLIYDIIKKKYKKHYILDYRDVTFEKFYLYKKIIDKMVINSVATFISSDAFRKILPNCDNIYTTHNLMIESLQHRNVKLGLMQKKLPIKIGFWGFIRHYNINLQIIKKLANDERFELHYYGREQETAYRLKQYCAMNNIKNVFFHGEYNPQDRYDFIKNIDIIHNVYENDGTTDYALGNKFYDGIIFYIPQICNENSYMGEIVEKYKVGCTCDPNNQSFLKDIYNYFQNINYEEFKIYCDIALKIILNEYNECKKSIKKIARE